ncbi:MAG: uracil phosphoribosyltransferase [Opitutaceae bacterium]
MRHDLEPANFAEVPHVSRNQSFTDRELNAKKYILPGLGDFGDRLYGT